MSRWLARTPTASEQKTPRGQLRLRSWATLIPSDSNLSELAREEERIAELMGKRAVRSPRPSDEEKVLELLDTGEYDWIHIASHGRLTDAVDSNSSYVELENGWKLTPNAFRGGAVTRHIKDNFPGFFLNTCHGGRQGWSLTGLGGWANRLIEAGAGLFLSPMWSVADDRAVIFAETFYQHLLAGKTAAQAVRLARLQVKADGDPTWLAYSLYAHPNATIASSD